MQRAQAVPSREGSCYPTNGPCSHGKARRGREAGTSSQPAPSTYGTSRNKSLSPTVRKASWGSDGGREGAPFAECPPCAGHSAESRAHLTSALPQQPTSQAGSPFPRRRNKPKGPSPRTLGRICTPPMLWHTCAPSAGKGVPDGPAHSGRANGSTGRAGGLPSQGMGSRERTVPFTSEATTARLGRLGGWSVLEATRPGPGRACQGLRGDGLIGRAGR